MHARQPPIDRAPDLAKTRQHEFMQVAEAMRRGFSVSRELINSALSNPLKHACRNGRATLAGADLAAPK